MSLLNKPASRLLPIDYVFMGGGAYPIEFVFFFDTRIDTGRFKAALDDTIPFFHLISSRLFALGANEFELRYHPEGLIFDSAILFDEMAMRAPWSCLESVRTLPDEPLCRIQLTQFADGSALGISISHLVADGFSCFHFLAQLSRAYRGLPVVSPSYQRNWYLASRTNQKAPRLNEQLFETTGFTIADPRQDIPHTSINRQKLHFSHDLINELLAEARLTASVAVSTNDVITAKLWQTFIPRWHGAFADQNSCPRITVPFDVRRIADWLDPCFFGNAVCLTGGAYSGEQFSTATLGELASFVRTLISRVTRAYVQDAFDFLEDYRIEFGLAPMESLHVVDPHDGLLVTNLTRVPLGEIIFAGNPPFRFLPVTRSPRTAILLPDDAGGIIADVTLPCNVLSSPEA